MRGCPLVWASRRQQVRATSTCEAEYVAIFDGIKLALGQSYLEWFLGTQGTKIPLIFTDSQSAPAVSNQTLIKLGMRSKHINIRYHMVKDHHC